MADEDALGVGPMALLRQIPNPSFSERNFERSSLAVAGLAFDSVTRSRMLSYSGIVTCSVGSF